MQCVVCLFAIALAGCGGRALPTWFDPDAPVLTELEREPGLKPLLPAGGGHLSFVARKSTATEFEVELRGVRPGGLLANAVYAGWCVDPVHNIELEVEYPAEAYSSLGARAALRQPGADWPRINWLVNHRDAEQPEHVQYAIWHFIDGQPPEADPTRELIARAEVSGEGFAPEAGERLGVLLDSSPDRQLILIEVELPER